tara:strand:- start:3940 stop:4179 length:240 start_codon:yes stop_codon:yes gene_type:complete
LISSVAADQLEGGSGVDCSSMSNSSSQPTEFNPLAMVDMWQDMRALVEEWESKYNCSPVDAAAAFQEFSAALVDQPKST